MRRKLSQTSHLALDCELFTPSAPPNASVLTVFSIATVLQAISHERRRRQSGVIASLSTQRQFDASSVKCAYAFQPLPYQLVHKASAPTDVFSEPTDSFAPRHSLGNNCWVQRAPESLV